MSWSSSLHRATRAAGTGFVLLGLGGCLEPMYGTLGGHLGSELQAVSVDPVPDRLGHYLHDQLLTDLNGTGQKVPSRYHLTVTASENVQTALIDTVTQRSQNASVVTNVNYTLYANGSDTPLAKGTVLSSAAYDRSEQRFANIRAARDAEIRDAKTVADQITTRVASALAHPVAVAPTPLAPPPPPLPNLLNPVTQSDAGALRN